jgi:hypothetical protein
MLPVFREIYQFIVEIPKMSATAGLFHPSHSSPHPNRSNKSPALRGVPNAPAIWRWRGASEDIRSLRADDNMPGCAFIFRHPRPRERSPKSGGSFPPIFRPFDDLKPSNHPIMTRLFVPQPFCPWFVSAVSFPYTRILGTNR